MRLRNVSNGFLPDLHEIDLGYALYKRIHTYDSGQSSVGLEDEEFYDTSLTYDVNHVVSTGRLIKDILVSYAHQDFYDKSLVIFVDNKKYFFGFIKEGDSLEADIIISINSNLKYKKIKADILCIINGNLNVEEVSSYHRGLVILDEIDVKRAYLKGSYVITNYFGGRVTKIATEISSQNTVDIEEHIVFERDKKQIKLDKEDVENIFKSIMFVIQGLDTFLGFKTDATFCFYFDHLIRYFPGLYDEDLNIDEIYKNIDDSFLKDTKFSYRNITTSEVNLEIADDISSSVEQDSFDILLDDTGASEQETLSCKHVEDVDTLKDAILRILSTYYPSKSIIIEKELLNNDNKDELVGMLKLISFQKKYLKV